MKQLFTIFICILNISILKAQYYKTPEWTGDLPYATESNVIYAIGISDPRTTNNILAEAVAINRAISMALIFSGSEIQYTSDYFEKQSEEYKWVTIKENHQELGRITASAYVDTSNYEIIKSEINENNEAIVLIRFYPGKSNNHNFFVNIEYYRQDFESNNLRDYENIKYIKFNSGWLNSITKDTLLSEFHLTGIDSDINCKITYDTIEINPPGYYYQYYSTLNEDFDLKNFNNSAGMIKGLWIAYLDSFIQSALKISKNYNSKFKTVSDDYKINRNDDINETHTESLSRISGKNKLSFEYGGFGIYNNKLFPRIYLKDEREYYTKNSQAIKEDTASKENHIQNTGKKTCWIKRLFSKNI